MNKSLLIIGVALVIAGVISGAYSVSKSQLFGLVTTSSTPYQNFAMPLIVGGVVLVIAGIFTGSKS